MSLGEVDQALMSLRDNINNPPPYQSRIEDPYLFGHIFDEETGSVMTHRMAQMDNYAFPMIQFQRSGPDIGTLKDFGEDTAGAWEAAKKAGNYKKFDTEGEAKAYAAGGYKTPELEYYGKVESKHARTGNRQSVEPDYGPQGLRHVAPVIEFGFGGLAKAGTGAVNKLTTSKAYSNIKDKWTKFRTPDKVYHGGPPNLSTIKTPYDRAIKAGEPTSKNAGLATDKSLQAGTYTGAKAKEVVGYMKGDVQVKNIPGTKPSTIVKPGSRGSGLYEIDISDASKVYNFNKPSKYMRGEIMKEMELLKSQGKRYGDEWEAMNNLLEGADTTAYSVPPYAREFLEKYGYQAWKHLEASKRTRVVIFRPEKYKIKELDKLPGTEKVRSIYDIKGYDKATKRLETRRLKLEAKAKKKRSKNPMAYKK